MIGLHKGKFRRGGPLDAESTSAGQKGQRALPGALEQGGTGLGTGELQRTGVVRVRRQLKGKFSARTESRGAQDLEHLWA